MPEGNSSSNEQHINPEHFPANRPEQRAQNFSFATSYPYAPGRSTSNHNTNNNHNHNNNNKGNHQQTAYNVQRYQSPYNFQHVVTNAFSVLHNSVDLDEQSTAQHSKPNQAIVRPIIREQSEHADEPIVAAGSISSNPPLTTRSFFSRSTQEVRSFADELSQKLRFLAPDENYGRGGGGGGSSGHSSATAATGAWLSGRQMERPRFETTVPTGIFLPPPHELQMLPPSMLRRHVYAYSSYPMILHNYCNASNQCNNNNNNNNNNSIQNSNQNKDTNRQIPQNDKENNKASTRQNGVRATAAVAAATAAAAASKADGSSLAGGLHITKAQFQQQLQQRRNFNSDKR
ncbi:uncharacterized protein Dmoj_GI27021 [Drosophila mojavensis]|uniref:Uncharacterized protein n=2 Tax=Drosophila mojavensis TaxID=7230 RepID=A0A0Q9XMX6_DROMO|nr:uncharacterized protein Dmoj_GI27021 [Drosophila mojavensis]